MQTVTRAVGPTQIARQILVVPNQVFDFLNRARQRRGDKPRDAPKVHSGDVYRLEGDVGGAI
jgi:hypothetical protein